MTIGPCRYLALATFVTSIVFCAHVEAQTRVDEWLSVTTGPLAVLLDPSSSSVVVATLSAGTRVHAEKLQDGWYFVRLAKAPDQRAPVSGWVPAGTLAPLTIDIPVVATSGRTEPPVQAVAAVPDPRIDPRPRRDQAAPPIPALERAPDVWTARIDRPTLDRVIQAAEALARSDAGVDAGGVEAGTPVIEYRVLATNKTSTMQKEMQEAAEAGFRFGDVMGGNTAFGGSEVVVIMHRGASPDRFAYRLLATSKTSTMQKELQEAGDAGFAYRGQSVFKSAFGGKEVVAILERPEAAKSAAAYEYRLLASTKTSTMQKELAEAGAQAFEFVGVTVAKTLGGGDEIVVILRRKL